MSSTHIELRKLQHVVVLSRERNYQRAARELGLTQSALTRSIQSLEARFAVRLFDRGRSGVRLTAVGRALVERAQVMLQDAGDLAQHLRRVGSGDEGEVAFGMSPLAAKAVLAGVLSDQLRLRPQMQASVAVRSAEALMPLLLDEQIEFFVATLGSVPTNVAVEATLLGSPASTFLVRSGHPLAGRDHLTEADWAAFPLVISTQPSRAFAAAHQGTGPKPPSIVTDDYETLMTLTYANDAIWLTSSIAYPTEIGRGELIALNPLEGPTTRSAQLASFRLAKRTLSPLGDVLLEEILTRLDRLCRAGR